MFIGHGKIINFLDNSIKRGNIAHAYLFSGPEHLGKFSVALGFARKITLGSASQHSSGEINPDIVIISPEIEENKGVLKKKNIKVEKIREMTRALSLSSYFGKYKVAVIDEADSLSSSAQNALLKTLEEPAPKCVLILISHNREKILPTVRSRCLTLKFNLVKDAEIAGGLENEKSQEEIIAWSLGRPGLALELQKDKKQFQSRKEAVEDFRKILKSNLNDKFVAAQDLSKDPESLNERIGLWMALLRKNILGRESSFGITAEKALFLTEEMEKSLALIRETNSSTRSIMENLFLKF